MKAVALFFLWFFLFPNQEQKTCEEVKDLPVSGMKKEDLMSNLQLCGVDSTDFPLVGAFLVSQLQKEGSLDSLTHSDIIVYLDSLKTTPEYKMLKGK